jgi:hypothetical protein
MTHDRARAPDRGLFYDDRRESACPVHFVWDGRGVGRPLVRAGFLLFLLAGTLVTAATMLHSAMLRDGAALAGIAGTLAWAAGQVGTVVVRRLTGRRAPRSA